jgi:hypothetical protein
MLHHNLNIYECPFSSMNCVTCWFQVGFFPAECVEMFGEKIPQAVATKIPEATKPGQQTVLWN